MSAEVHFSDIARLPAAGDNAAIATRRIDRCTDVRSGGMNFSISATVLEGHRFAVTEIPAGAPLLSWGLPFGLALRDIAPGDYLCNTKVLTELRNRRLDFPIPDEPNFKDHRIDFRLDESGFRAAPPPTMADNPLRFPGYERPGRRGSGTRNYIVVLGTSSRTASIARLVAAKFRDVSNAHPSIDGVVPVAHTEGGGAEKPNNLEFTLRTLAGFMVHPNVAAVLAIDTGTEPVNNVLLQGYMLQHGYPLEAVPHRFLSAKDGLTSALRDGVAIIEHFIPEASRSLRTTRPLSHLRLGLQCGGSDAFSGVSANPLLGCLARDVIRHGGSANLAETSELIGAEPYVLRHVCDLATAKKFLQLRDRFQEWAGWHGHSAEGNPSGGNLYRGLYNIVIKSIGAALKKHPETSLDFCIDYAGRMYDPGYYFMDSPGNDLESIAGQVASGCNLLLFSTGNGSITNFPFVPTIKAVTTTGRYNLLRAEMDFNAGRYLDGTPMETLAAEAFELSIQVAGGSQSAGEKAGHSQVQLWRDWAQTDATRLEFITHRPKPSGEPLSVASETLNALAANLPGISRRSTPRVGLIVPTSLCAGQIALQMAAELNVKPVSEGASSTRYLALPHTEGCGNSRGESEELYMRTMTGYLRHPSVKLALLLEHGCEKTHNDEMRAFMARHGVDATRLGFASIQMDGGIESVTGKVKRWFANKSGSPIETTSNSGTVSIGMVIDDSMPDLLVNVLARLICAIVKAGGNVILPQSKGTNPLLQHLHITEISPPTLAYGQHPQNSGLHLMENSSSHLVETLTGLGACGTDLILNCSNQPVTQRHPLVPVVQIATQPTPEADCVIAPDDDPVTSAQVILDLSSDAINGHFQPSTAAAGNVDFQVARGYVGVSL